MLIDVGANCGAALALGAPLRASARGGALGCADLRLAPPVLMLIIIFLALAFTTFFFRLSPIFYYVHIIIIDYETKKSKQHFKQGRENQGQLHLS
jgi:hypothetical protein